MTTLENEMNALKEQMSKITNKLEKEVKKGLNGDKAGSLMDESKEKLSEMAEDLGSKLQYYFRENKKKLNEAKDNYEKAVGDHPFTTTLTAFAAGAIVAAIFCRK